MANIYWKIILEVPDEEYQYALSKIGKWLKEAVWSSNKSVNMNQLRLDFEEAAEKTNDQT